ncbi:Presenilin enhancer-2 subunit of gamma secretase-domain-containing protein, partial [Gaertneriomyces semiglobifer]
MQRYVCIPCSPRQPLSSFAEKHCLPCTHVGYGVESTEMSLRNMKETEIRSLAWKYFIGGFLFLPWLWLFNFIYIYPETRRHMEWSKTIRNLTLASLAGSLVYVVIITMWIWVYLSQRTHWGITGDRLSINISVGS